MEHSCSLLLHSVSFLFAQALPLNGTELPKPATTTSSIKENNLHKDLLTLLLILVLAIIIAVVLAGCSLRFRRQMMPNGILEEQDDCNQVNLSVKRGQECIDYINASFIDEKCCQYWPSEGSETHIEITVEIKSDSLLAAISVRDFLGTYNQSNQEKQSSLVRQFHSHGWPEIGIALEGKGMINLIAAVQKQQQQTGNRPITVHCSACAGRTGTFIALSNILEQMKAEGLLHVFQAVKSLRLQRPHMVQTLEQYEFC